jgi:hypothetical protein
MGQLRFLESAVMAMLPRQDARRPNTPRDRLVEALESSKCRHRGRTPVLSAWSAVARTGPSRRRAKQPTVAYPKLPQRTFICCGKSWTKRSRFGTCHLVWEVDRRIRRQQEFDLSGTFVGQSFASVSDDRPLCGSLMPFWCVASIRSILAPDRHAPHVALSPSPMSAVPPPSPPPAPPPDSLQKGLLQILWTARPWVRNVILVFVGMVLFIVTFMPQDLRDGLVRKIFHVDDEQSDSFAHPALDDENAHAYRLKNGHSVRLAGSIVRNQSNVANNIIVEAIESDAWRYNYYCYDGEYGHLPTALPSGTVTVEFDILDQLPQHVRVGGSDFDAPGFGACVARIVSQQTLNAASASGSGHVAYAFKFLPS